MSAATRAAVASGLALLAGCQIVLDLSEKVYVADAGTGGEAGATSNDGGASSDDSGPTPEGGDASPVPVTCPPGAKGPTMVRIGQPDAGGGVDVAGQPPECSWNTTYQPGPGCETNSTFYTCVEPVCGRLPQACVDWCDASAYCRWAGKRLCGAPGRGAASLTSVTDPARSQWTAACTSGGKHPFPYGESYVPFTCPDDGDGSGQRVPKQVATFPDCQSKEPAFKGVFDLSGNVAEWEDACIASSGSTDACRIRGGAFSDGEERVRCDVSMRVQRDFTDPEIGFRCCAP